jgi:hypothetical protein
MREPTCAVEIAGNYPSIALSYLRRGKPIDAQNH